MITWYFRLNTAHIERNDMNFTIDIYDSVHRLEKESIFFLSKYTSKICLVTSNQLQMSHCCHNFFFSLSESFYSVERLSEIEIKFVEFVPETRRYFIISTYIFIFLEGHVRKSLLSVNNNYSDFIFNYFYLFLCFG